MARSRLRECCDSISWIVVVPPNYHTFTCGMIIAVNWTISIGPSWSLYFPACAISLFKRSTITR
ncbi:MAG: hypothetical protein J3Q66DRAFT_350437 [Benniella sp.]|nr:MAG: hypothetical protein J3Q66DRAFT_350437 [Benniella sp.]